MLKGWCRLVVLKGWRDHGSHAVRKRTYSQWPLRLEFLLMKKAKGMALAFLGLGNKLFTSMMGCLAPNRSHRHDSHTKTYYQL